MSIINFPRISGDEIDVFIKYPDLYENFWSESDLIIENNVTDEDLQINKYYFDDILKFGAVIKNKNLVVPANLQFKVVDTYIHYALFSIRRNGVELEITDLTNDLSLSVELTSLGEKIYKIYKEQHLTMLEAIEQLEYYANILNVDIKNL